MADLTFGESLHCLDGSEYAPWVKNTLDFAKDFAVMGAFRRWHLLSNIVTRMLPKSIKEAKKLHTSHSSARVDKRLEKETDRPDIWSFVLRHSGTSIEKEKSLSQQEMYSNASSFMFAGTETTATELSGMTYFLLKHPDKMERLKKEIRGAFKSSDDITMLELSELKYLHACLEEGLRIYPHFATILPRSVPKEGAKINGEWIPGGSVVSLYHYAAYHSESNFKNPKSFVPERWLPEGEAEYNSDKKHALISFSYGPRACIGKNLAHHEIRLVLASLLLNFDLGLVNKDMVWSDQKTYIIWEKTSTYGEVDACESVIVAHWMFDIHHFRLIL